MIWARPYRGQSLRAPDTGGLIRSTFASFMLHALFIGIALFFGWRSQGPLVSAEVPFVELSLQDLGAGAGRGEGAYVGGRGRSRSRGPVALGKLPGSSFRMGMSRRKLNIEKKEVSGEPDTDIDEEPREGEEKKDIPLSAFKPVSVGLTGSIGEGREKESLELAIYKAQVLEAIKGRWAYAGGLEKGLTAQVVLHVTSRGRLLDVKLAGSSGNPLFDSSVIKAVRASEPLPPFPAIFNRDTETIVVEFRSEERG